MQDALLTEIANDLVVQEPESLSVEILASRMKSYGKECFPDFSIENYNLENYINRAAILSSFALDSVYKKDMIHAENGYVFWLSEYAAQFFSLASNNSKKTFLSDEGQREARELFKKWCATTDPKEKTYFGLSLLNHMKRNYSEENLVNLVITSIVFLYDPRLRSFEKALPLLERIESQINESGSPQEVKNELLETVYIFKGFNYLLEQKYAEAADNFECTLHVNAYSPTGLYYSLLLSIKNGNISLALENLSTILNYDLRRIELALDANSISLVEFYAKNSILANIFLEEEFAHIFQDVKLILNSSITGSTNTNDEIVLMLEKLSKMGLEEYLDEPIQINTTFLFDYTRLYKNYQNILLNILKEKFLNKSKNLVLKIMENIQTALSKRIDDDLKIYDGQITDAIKKIEHFEKEIETIKSSSKEHLKEAILELEESIKQQINALENRIHKLEESKESNAYSGFNNNMVLNLIVSMVIFIFGGFVNGISESASQSLNYAEVIRSIFSSGFKWSGIVFVLGLIISIIGFVANLIETHHKKQRIMRRISTISGRKEAEINRIKSEYESREKSRIDFLTKKISELQKGIDALKEEKEKRREGLKEEFQRLNAPIITSLNELVTNF
ncbi:MAG TPA: hypothetical protein PK397_01870 [Ignavibacteriaceae bacterium]|nr:hypothetical protein [Ignavibacteriaceae bacterium]